VDETQILDPTVHDCQSLDIAHISHRNVAIHCRYTMSHTMKKQDYRILFEYDSQTYESFTRLVLQILPSCTLEHVTRLYNLRFTTKPRYPTGVKELELLLTYLNEYLQGTFEDPTCGVKTIEQVLLPHLPNVTHVGSYDNDPTVFPTVVLDALNPFHLNCVTGRPDYVIFSPPFSQTDTFLFFMARRAKKAVIALIAGDYLTNAPPWRVSAWNQYADTGRTHVIAGLPLVPGRPVRRAIWVIIAKTKKGLTTLLKPGTVISSFHLGGGH
jgi:hypothetical protein